MTTQEKAAGAATPATAISYLLSVGSASVAETIGKCAAADALAVLRQPTQDRQCELSTGVGCAMLLGDSSGTPVEFFDDHTTVHMFLQWLDQQRVGRAERHRIEVRRSRIKLVKGSTR